MVARKQLGMQKMFRVSVIARLRTDVSQQKVEALVAPLLVQKGLSLDDCLRWISITSNDGENRYVKISTLIPLGQLDDAWNLRVSRLFAKAGYGEVAWKITPVREDDPDGEDTTWSIQQELFQALTASSDPEADEKPGAPPPPFGSDAFWDWFGEETACPIIKEGDDVGAMALNDFPNPGPGRSGLPIVCASCRRMRDAHGAWITMEFPQRHDTAAGCSHGICPQCAKKLYPDLYPD